VGFIAAAAAPHVLRFAVERLGATSPAGRQPSSYRPKEADNMGSPLCIDIPHRLGIAAARQRIGASLDQIGALVPGGMARDARWQGNRLACMVDALGQRIACELDVRADSIRASLDLPPLLMAFADVIRVQVVQAGAAIVREGRQ
jgi:hypothetical protein